MSYVFEKFVSVFLDNAKAYDDVAHHLTHSASGPYILMNKSSSGSGVEFQIFSNNKEKIENIKMPAANMQLTRYLVLMTLEDLVMLKTNGTIN